ncbi:MAG: TIGR00282 family metallophosphoesterase [Thermoanaerobaculia bacterium]
MVRLLYIGDTVGQPGRRALRDRLETVIDREMIDFTIVNIENAAGGFGVTDSIMHELLQLPIDVFTSGNHIWDKRDFVEQLDQWETLIRPANYPTGNPGKGRVVRPTATGINVGVVQVMGQVFMPPCENPFHVVERELEALRGVPVILVDIHCEATSEKQAMGRFLDGRVSAVVGTHTHVPTADERILPKGTGFQTDVGMTGAYDSIIGFRPEEILERFTLSTPRKMEVAKRDIRLTGVIVDVDEATGRATRIARVQERLDES